jgi:hypothetical protein
MMKPPFCKRGQVLLAFCFYVVGCAQEMEPPREALGPIGPADTVVHEWRPQSLEEAGAPKRALGERCDTYGPDECASGVCVRTWNGTRLCSRDCSVDSECPDGWGCVSMVPGGAEHICLPRPVRR